MNNLLEYLKDNLIKFEQVSENIVRIGEKTYQLVSPDKEGVLFDSLFQMTCDDTDEDNYVFEFGGKWYWTPKGTETNPKLNLLKYINEANIESPYIPWFGIHGKYEILNGSRDYKDWCKKAKFLKCDTLGICELNTLAGVLQFQEECKSNGIKSITGETFVIRNQKNDLHYRIKLYAKNEKGWQTLLKFNKSVNVDNNGFVDENYFWDNIEDCVIVIDTKYCDFEYINKKILSLDDCYYQLDTVQYDNQDSDKKYLENLGKFIKSSLKSILIQDSYYLDKEEAYIKTKLNQIAGDREFKSNNQYFKCFDQIFDELDQLFDKNSSTFDSLLDQALKSLYIVSKQCNFKVSTEARFLPRYIMKEEEKERFKTNRELFDYLIEEGFKKKTPKGKEKEYRERIEREIDVVEYGDVIDYFLILWDIVDWCKKNNILTGIGRGSGGGTLIAYYLNLIHLDPIKFDLLFERFLNKGRVKVSLPDLDTDFEGLRRSEVKRYMESRYRTSQVCSVGTYTTLKIKALLKDLGRLHSTPIPSIEYINKIISDDNIDFSGFFKLTGEYKSIKDFIKDNSIFINDIPLIHKQPRSTSIHACATLILPDEKTIFEWVPVKKMQLNDGEDVLVSEWEGVELEKAGFLKEDILGIQQLDKFRYILNSIEKVEGEKVDIYNLPYDDKKVYEYFCNGWNGDVFHFGSTGLTGYCKMLQPHNIDDLVAGIALYRPGAMESNFHNEYVLRSRKFVQSQEGQVDVEYFEGCESITKDTFGLIIYQEQIMKICCEVGGFSLIEADDIRKGMGKKKQGVIDKYEKEFVERAVKNGYDRKRIEELWSMMKEFAKYSFNKSHAAAYSITGYISQWLKVHYPLHYWTCSFSFLSTGKQDEIHQTGDIKMLPPDINKSGDGFTPDFKTNSIYWSLNSVKQCGDRAVEQIVEDKKKNGDYFSFSEFLERNMFKGSKTSKAVVEHLILCGSFDEIEKIKYPKDRYELIDTYRKKSKTKIDKEKDLFEVNQDMLQYNWWWSLQQKRLCGFALFDLETICENYLDSDSKYMDAISIQDRESQKKNIVTGGYINEIVVRTSKKGEYADIILDNNFEFITVKLWQDTWSVAKSIFENKEKCLLLLSGQVSYDKYKKKNIVTLFEDSDILVLE